MYKIISPTVIQFYFKAFGSFAYLVKLKEPILIDLGSKQNKQELREDLQKLGFLHKIKTIILTHLHWDHIGTFDLFQGATFYASKKEIDSLKKDKPGTLASNEDYNLTLTPLKKLEGFEIIETPGHTIGSISLFYKKEKILFSGDTIFGCGLIGRTDLPNSSEEKMQQSLKKLEKIDYKILCPGH